MNHEELLEAVKDIPTTRAVVELHRPHDITWTGEIVPETFCEGCNEEYYVKYPCSTIQAIEEELK